MADNTKEIVKALKDIASELHQINKGIKDAVKSINQKQLNKSRLEEVDQNGEV